MVSVHEAKTHLSRLIDQALDGNDVVISRSGKPVVRLVRISSSAPVLGSARGEAVLQPGWDNPLTDEEIHNLFGGE